MRRNETVRERLTRVSFNFYKLRKSLTVITIIMIILSMFEIVMILLDKMIFSNASNDEIMENSEWFKYIIEFIFLAGLIFYGLGYVYSLKLENTYYVFLLLGQISILGLAFLFGLLWTSMGMFIAIVISTIRLIFSLRTGSQHYRINIYTMIVIATITSLILFTIGIIFINISGNPFANRWESFFDDYKICMYLDVISGTFIIFGSFMIFSRDKSGHILFATSDIICIIILFVTIDTDGDLRTLLVGVFSILPLLTFPFIHISGAFSWNDRSFRRR